MDRTIWNGGYMRAIIGTMNPGKIQGAKKALEAFFDKVEIEGYKADSEVGDQPVAEETIEGARNRARNAMKYAKSNGMDVDLFMGIESGIMNLYDKWFIVNAAIVIDKNGFESIGYGPCFPVPIQYVEEIIKTDFGHVVEKLFHKKDLGKSVGGVDGLTNHTISRIDITREAFTMALIEQCQDYWTEKDRNKKD